MRYGESWRMFTFTVRIGDQQRFEAMGSDGIRGLGMEIPRDVDKENTKDDDVYWLADG